MTTPVGCVDPRVHAPQSPCWRGWGGVFRGCRFRSTPRLISFTPTGVVGPGTEGLRAGAGGVLTG